MEKKINVLYIPSWFPDNKNPKHGIYFKEQAEMLDKYCNIFILNIERISLKYIKNIFGFLIKKNKFSIKNNVILYKYVDYTLMNLDLRVKLFKKNVFKSFDFFLKNYELPDIIHSQVTYPAGYAAYLISKKYHIPFIITEHSSSFENYYKLFNSLYKLILKEADYYTSVSNFVRTGIIKYRKQCEVIPNFIDFNKFKKSNKNFISNYKNKFNLINISDIEKLKGIDVLLNALAILIHKYKIKNLFLHIIGSGEQLEEYKNLSIKLKIDNYLKFYGLVVYNDIVGYLKNCSCLVIASRVETFGIVGIEGMACGLPVVSTDCGGPADYIRNFNGILVNNEDPEDLADGIKKVIYNFSKFNKYKIINFFNKNFTDEIVCSKIIKIYRKVINKKIK